MHKPTAQRAQYRAPASVGKIKSPKFHVRICCARFLYGFCQTLGHVFTERLQELVRTCVVPRPAQHLREVPTRGIVHAPLVNLDKSCLRLSQQDVPVVFFLYRLLYLSALYC